MVVDGMNVTRESSWELEEERRVLEKEREECMFVEMLVILTLCKLGWGDEICI